MGTQFLFVTDRETYSRIAKFEAIRQDSALLPRDER
jgi:hypothetical protein